MDAAREAISLAAGRTRQEFENERVVQLAVIRLLEVIGEAATAATAETRSSIPDIPWAAVAGMRNRLIHGYDSVDLDVVWQTVKSDLPSLVHTLERALRDGAKDRAT